MPTVLFEVDAYDHSLVSAAYEFAQTYWPEPREMKWLSRDNTFQVGDDVATYRVEYVARFLPRPVYQVFMVSE